MSLSSSSLAAEADPGKPAVMTGAAYLQSVGFAPLAGKRVGLITNQTGLVGEHHLADLIAKAEGVRLTAIFAPEHGFRGTAEAGASVHDGRDDRTGVPVFSLYGGTKKPTAQMLRDVDVLVFDIQDVGVRFYTYISTMGLAMQGAAERGIPFFVLDRPNPLGGVEVSGFMLDPALKSFVGQYPIPIVHGLTVGELAQMIQGERWLGNLERSQLTVVAMKGWTRGMRWPAAKLPWVATSPNIPTFEAALVYPGIGLVGETLVNEGRGTPIPFSQFGAPWLEAEKSAGHLNDLRLPGVRFEATRYTPRSIPNVAEHPRFEGQQIQGIQLAITDANAYRPLDVGAHVLAHLQSVCRARRLPLFDKLTMFNATSGTTRLHGLLQKGANGAEIIASWRSDTERFTALRQRYLVY